MTDRVDTAMKREKMPRLEPALNGLGGEAEQQELLATDYAVLTPSERGQHPIRMQTYDGGLCQLTSNTDEK